ncbi:MAG: hypothetical protein ACYC27_14215 [Armatimonadota bacterium]
MSIELNLIGEVIEASTTEFAAESRELHSPPPFGSFVKVRLNGHDSMLDPEPEIVPVSAASLIDDDPFEDRFRRMAGSFNTQYSRSFDGDSEPEAKPRLASATYAVVYQASTTPTDSGRRPRAYWKDEQQLNDEQPELSEWLLVTQFSAIIIGHSSEGVIRQFLPPLPPKIHAFVEPCTDNEIRALTSRMDFLRTLANFRNAPVEEVVAACIREANRSRGDDFDFLVSAGKELAGLLKDDYDQLQAIMRRIAL